VAKGAGTPTGVGHRERVREADLGAVAATGAGEMRPQLLDQSINQSSYQIPLQVLMFFFTCHRMGFCPNLWTVFFVFFSWKRNKKEVFTSLMRRFLPSVNSK
jgi:ABC-type multidrug transport system permease subunit